MQLKALDICGFKSFPDRIQLQFNGGITAVVGPNGSGKSNIADAVRWVLGEQSGKTLRSGKMEDVIFTGTQQRRAMGFASVTLFIDNADRSLGIESDEVAVGRKLYRTGDSEYRINGTAVRLRDINELLMDTGLGRDGYSIIGQGRIAEIVGAKSAQRREIFEEAAGITKYRYRKEQAEKTLEQAQENLLRLKDILLELESRVEPLRIQSEKAAEYLRYAERKRTLEISLWLATVEKSREQLRAQEDKLLSAQGEHDELEQALNEAESTIQAIYDQIAACNIETENLRGEISAIGEQKARMDAQAAVMENDIRHNDETRQRLEESIADQSANRAQVEAQIAESAGKAAEKEAALTELESRARALRDAREELEQESGDIARRQASATQEKTAVAKKIADERMIMAASSTMREQLALNAQSIGAQERQGEEVRLRQQAQMRETQSMLETIDGETLAQQNIKKGCQMKHRSAQELLAQIKASRDELSGKQKGYLQKARLLEDMEKNMEGFQQSVKYIMTQAKGGSLRGIEGPVSRLIEVEGEYSAAIEVALAGAMQNIVVTTEAAAKVAIQSLKSAHAGRATFLPVSVIRARTLEETGLEGCEGFIAVASGLVKADGKYSGIVGNLLGRIAIVRDMDSAIAIAGRYAHRFKIVTLDGQVINAGGSMTGGSLSRNAGILSRGGEISRLRQLAADAQAQWDALAGDEKAANEEASRLSAQIEAIDADVRTMSEDRIRCEAEQKRLTLAAGELEQRQEEARGRAEEIGQRLAELERESGSRDELLREWAALEARLDAELLAALAAAGEAARGIAENGSRLALLDLERLTLEKDMDTIRQLSAQLSGQLDAQMGQAGALRAQVEDLERRNEETRAAIAQKRAEAEALAGRNQGHNERIGCLNRDKILLEQKATQERQRERDLHSQREVLARNLAKLEERKFAIQNEYDQIVARLYDEYELTLTQATAVREPIEDAHEANRELAALKGRIKALGSINVAAIEEFREVSERYEFMKRQIGDVEQSREQLLRLIQDLTVEMQDIFLTSFNAINGHFSSIFTELFGGGSARLLLDNPSDVLGTGIEITVQPPGKIIKNLAALSGGEQAFVAIAIYFAILKVRPSPFCLLDEIEAALDDVNVTKYAQYLRKLTSRTQFIAITHRRGTMEEADVLYGVTMEEEGVSKLLRLGVAELESKLGI